MSDQPRPSYQRSAKNYLLDKQFQLKYTGMLVGLALVMSLILGGLLWYSSSQVVRESEKSVELGHETVKQSEETVKQGQLTVERGKLVIEESRKVSELVTMQIEGCYPDDPLVKQTFKRGTDDEEAKRHKEQDALEADAADLSKRAGDLATRAKDLEAKREQINNERRNMIIVLVIALALLVFGIGVAGIVFTHKIAGPIFKMKRLMREVGEGKLLLREKLRKGDELQHFFETFEKMVEQMRENQRREIKRIDVILDELNDDKDAGLSALRQLRDDMKDHIGA